MGSTRKAWIQTPDYLSVKIGETSREEITRAWGSRWAQKCIRDTAELFVTVKHPSNPEERHSRDRHAHRETPDFCPPQLGFENGVATLVVSPWTDVKSPILYGTPLEEFSTWTVSLQIRGGRRLFGLIPITYAFEAVVSQSEALELVHLFFDYTPQDLVLKTRTWREQVNERYRFLPVGFFFM